MKNTLYGSKQDESGEVDADAVYKVIEELENHHHGLKDEDDKVLRRIGRKISDMINRQAWEIVQGRPFTDEEWNALVNPER